MYTRHDEAAWYRPRRLYQGDEVGNGGITFAPFPAGEGQGLKRLIQARTAQSRIDSGWPGTHSTAQNGSHPPQTEPRRRYRIGDGGNRATAYAQPELRVETDRACLPKRGVGGLLMTGGGEGMTRKQRRAAKLRVYLRKARDGMSRRRESHLDSLRYAPRPMRLEVLMRDGFRCRYCGTDLKGRRAHIDHVFPWHNGGVTAPDNLVTACPACNKDKWGGASIQPRALRNNPSDPFGNNMERALERLTKNKS